MTGCHLRHFEDQLTIAKTDIARVSDMENLLIKWLLFYIFSVPWYFPSVYIMPVIAHPLLPVYFRNIKNLSHLAGICSN